MDFLDNGLVVHLHLNGWAVRRFFENCGWYYLSPKTLFWSDAWDDHSLVFPSNETALKAASMFHECGRLRYDPSFGDDKLCADCGHPYYRHYDSYEENYPAGCKYCSCMNFMEKKD